jgi:hypothetical protein
MCCVGRKGAVRRRAKLFCWVCYAAWSVKERNTLQSSVQLAPRLLGANWDVLPLGLNTEIQSLVRWLPKTLFGRIWELGSLTSIMGGKISVVAASDTGIATVLAVLHASTVTSLTVLSTVNPRTQCPACMYWVADRSCALNFHFCRWLGGFKADAGKWCHDIAATAFYCF